MNITTAGINLAKNTFSVHGVDGHGKVILKKTVTRGKLLETFANLPPCRVAMEACSGAHHWARRPYHRPRALPFPTARVAKTTATTATSVKPSWTPPAAQPCASRRSNQPSSRRGMWRHSSTATTAQPAHAGNKPAYSSLPAAVLNSANVSARAAA